MPVYPAHGADFPAIKEAIPSPRYIFNHRIILEIISANMAGAHAVTPTIITASLSLFSQYARACALVAKVKRYGISILKP